MYDILSSKTRQVFNLIQEPDDQQVGFFHGGESEVRLCLKLSQTKIKRALFSMVCATHAEIKTIVHSPGFKG